MSIPLPQNEAVKPYAPASNEKKLVKKTLLEMRQNPQDIFSVVAGERIRGGKSEKICSPHAKNMVLAHAYGAEENTIDLAIKNACQTQKEWARMSLLDRAAVFLKAADLLASDWRPSINAITMLAQSKTIHQAEIDASCELIDFFRFNAYFAKKIAEEQPLHSPFGNWNLSEARGLEGFVFAVGPFNFTSISINLACAPALMGCAVLWKPALAALPASYLGLQLLEAAGLPPGVINLVTGDASMIGKKALAHPELAGIHFTGSTSTFNHLWQEAGKNLSHYRNYPRIVGETGGKDFVFAHPSADAQNLITALIRGAYEYQGQKCSAASRAYIPRSLWGQIKDRLIGEINEIKMGDPENFTNFMGAVIDARAFAKIESYIEHARSSNEAEILAGGSTDDSEGYFVRPTLIQAKTPRYRSMVEEIFGPVLTVYVYEDKDWQQMLTECDQATSYALTGAIFAQDRRDLRVMQDILRYSAGNLYINDKPTGAVVGQQPFGGSRGSGTNDKAGSVYNLTRWVSHRTIKENFMNIPNYRYSFMDEA
ncbi:MAG: L-glutamate gamma-semialdehyde dehydrogenase [Oligoflexales bacterium]|nr:L-glutamate gamma-semialdehyde dehydrogenase [Oligoflexales bacterium]